MSDDYTSYHRFSPNGIPATFYEAGQTYTLSSTGGADVPAFNINTMAPQKLIVTEPNLLTLNSIDSNQDFHLKWNGNNGIGEISVIIREGQKFNTISCRFVDDGEAIIPSNLLTQLRGVKTPPDSEFHLTISRTNDEYINSEEGIIDFRITSGSMSSNFISIQ